MDNIQNTMARPLKDKIRAILSGKPLENETADEKLLRSLYIVPKKNTGKDVSHYNKPKEEGITQQADLLYLPSDRFGYKYLLVVVDIATQRMDAIALKDRTTNAVEKAFDKIYNDRKILEIPVNMQYDSGSEFKIDDYLIKKKILPKRGATNQHSQQAFAEFMNYRIGKIIGQLQTEKELQTNKTSKAWLDYLNDIIDVLNEMADTRLEKLNKQNKKDLAIEKAEIKNGVRDAQIKPAMTEFAKDIKNNDVDTVLKTDVPRFGKISSNILEPGDKVRLALNRPLNVVNNKRLHGNFRAGDIRWTKEIHTIEKVEYLPNQVTLYYVSNIRDRAYKRNELQAL